jgi:ElaB/YqjD/DUF883 family membrane-anchored ribosome-binding protein
MQQSSSSVAITQADWARFRSNSLPMIDQLANGDNQLVEQAERQVDNLAERSHQQIEQVNGRRLSRLSPAQQRLISQSISASSAGTAASTITDAGIQQRELNNMSRSKALGFANAIGNQGIGLLSSAEAMKAQRDAHNKANRKGFMSSALGMIGTVAGGFFGGPLGASIGGAIGTGIGGKI